MEYSYRMMDYEFVDNGKVVTSGTCPSMFISILTVIYIDYDDNLNRSLRIYDGDSCVEIKSPADFIYFKNNYK
jgi:hypothetical protein